MSETAAALQVDCGASARVAPSLLSRMVRSFVLWLYRRKGWEIEGKAPEAQRCVIIGAPHTSNWDFVFFIGATHAFGVAPSFMGKKSLFRWPLRRFMFDMGGVPVDRSKRGNYVAELKKEFARREEMRLVIAPEGTRGEVNRWRSGFYHIALGAGVPMVCGMMDYKRKVVGLGPAGYTLAVESNVLTCKKPGTEKLYPLLCKKPSGETVRMTPVKGPDACPAGSKLEACPFGSALVVDHNFERDDCVQSTTDYVAPTSK